MEICMEISLLSASSMSPVTAFPASMEIKYGDWLRPCSHHRLRRVWRLSMELWEVLQPPLPRGAPHVSTVKQGLLVDPWPHMEAVYGDSIGHYARVKILHLRRRTCMRRYRTYPQCTHARMKTSAEQSVAPSARR